MHDRTSNYKQSTTCNAVISAKKKAVSFLSAHGLKLKQEHQTMNRRILLK